MTNSHPATVPVVVWTQRARWRLQNVLTPSELAAAALATHIDTLNATLVATLRDWGELVVLDLYQGYRHRPGEYTVLLDAEAGPEPGPRVVKLGPALRLDAEFTAWNSCRPDQFTSNAVFMGLTRHADPAQPDIPWALVYQDVNKHVGTEEVLFLEQALLRSVRFGDPNPVSLMHAFRLLFGTLGRTFYHAGTVHPPDQSTLHLQRRGLKDGPFTIAAWLKRWHADPTLLGIRQVVGMSHAPEAADFSDPVDYFHFLDGELSAGTPPARLLPRTLRGKSHGDLHGRNVQIGIDQQRSAINPALYDYEAMSPTNWIAWDFVKLETELKIRALEQLYDGPFRQRATHLLQFERDLLRLTYDFREHAVWLERPTGDTPRDRLLALMLTIREQAALHLGQQRTRARDWLHEYLFALAGYGLHTAQFENQSTAQHLAAYISAGVATAEYYKGQSRQLATGYED